MKLRTRAAAVGTATLFMVMAAFTSVRADPKDYDKIELNDRLSVVDLANLAPGKPVTVIIHKASGDVKIQANHSMTAQQITWFKAGSALNALN